MVTCDDGPAGSTRSGQPGSGVAPALEDKVVRAGQVRSGCG